MTATALLLGTACGSTASLLFWHRDIFHSRAGQRYAAIALTDQAGQHVSLAAWRGKVILLDFIYTGCGDICPLRTAQIARIQGEIPPRMRPDVQFVSVSVDPEHDDPAALRAYADRNGAVLSNWAFLTGSLNDIAQFASGFDVPASSAADPPTHVTTVYLLDQRGRTVDRYVGDTVDEAQLLANIETLVKE